MITYSDALRRYQAQTNNSSTNNTTFFQDSIQDGVRLTLGFESWPFLEKVGTETTVASQQAYDLPGDMDRLQSATITVGTYKYRPTKVASKTDWDSINSPTGVTSDVPSSYITYGGKIEFWPVPATSSNVITFNYLKSVRDSKTADYTTGTITTATNAGKSIVGSGTTWTDGMVGKYLKITDGNGDDLGDGLWYEIASVESATALTLSREYAGAAIAAGSATYAIGDAIPMPENYQVVPLYYAIAEYWEKEGDVTRANYYRSKYETNLTLFRDEYQRRTTDLVIDDGGYNPIINPNLDMPGIAA